MNISSTMLMVNYTFNCTFGKSHLKKANAIHLNLKRNTQGNNSI